MSEAYDDLYISEEYLCRVKFSREVKVRPFDQILLTGALPLLFEYGPLRHDSASDMSNHHATNGANPQSWISHGHVVESKSSRSKP
ncbi:hypothetical protein CYLTODRAFT_456291 [Cylindrobasidium torrendii FP15055 ss-10]|uniref:Uncharacterized protein n=1 Tax=Cylindrobasidium torrendii FP15055 ss-10 TaxID=1314674 RepID=A0A0D7B4P7_9AGAR|nr:hypothetical protein CYLTODRAFT_456291 [Cylindrobasidium torrendii FP15055 ss-10]